MKSRLCWQDKKCKRNNGAPTCTVLTCTHRHCPGNGGGNIWDANWYGWLAREMQRRGVQVAMKNMPDPVNARENKWLPFIIDSLAGGVQELHNTIVVGHSSGAAAAMRLAEKHKLRGMVLVA